MTDLLLLGRDAQCTHELTTIFLRAGYEVTEVRDIVSCCRQLQLELAPSRFVAKPLNDTSPLSVHQRGVTILNANAISANFNGGKRQEQLRDCIVSLARQLTPGWRLSMRHRRLEAPAGDLIELTSLEFSFIKIFTMVEVGEAVSRKQIVQAFGEDYLSYDQNRIDTMVRRLRQKIESRLGHKLPLNTERVRGFSFGDELIIDP